MDFDSQTLKQFNFHFAETYDEEYANKIEKSDRRFSDFDNQRRKESFDQLPKRTFLSDELKGKRMILSAGYGLKKILKRSNPFFGLSNHLWSTAVEISLRRFAEPHVQFGIPLSKHTEVSTPFCKFAFDLFIFTHHCSILEKRCN